MSTENSMNSVEKVEFEDWGIDSSIQDAGDIEAQQQLAAEKRKRSITAYYLPRWIEAVKDLTFETIVFPLEPTSSDPFNGCPDVLPFEQNMVRFEHKSPSDSPLWGPVKTKEEVVNLFRTSIRFRLGGQYGKYLCVRKYQPGLGPEYRCFWNRRLVAVGVQSHDSPPISEDLAQRIIEYLDQISNRIPFHRCVLDIAIYQNSFILIEFNSWETNSGAAPFSWIDDTDILYPESNDVVFRWSSGSLTIKRDGQATPLNLSFIDFDSKENIDQIQILKPKKPSNWLVTENRIYISTDIWLGVFDHSLKPLNWKRGVFRFEPIYLCTDGSIYAGGEYFDPYLKVLKGKCDLKVLKGKGDLKVLKGKGDLKVLKGKGDLKVLKGKEKDLTIFEEGDQYEELPFSRYGFYAIDRSGRQQFYRLHNNGKFTLHE
jgi:hypothetical protein